MISHEYNKFMYDTSPSFPSLFLILSIVGLTYSTYTKPKYSGAQPEVNDLSHMCLNRSQYIYYSRFLVMQKYFVVT